MRAACLAAVLAALSTLPVSAGALERSVEADWRGAWVVLELETASRCDALFTDNRVHGRFATARGHHGFERGELARIVDVDVHRSRIDVRIEIHEPLRMSWSEGPFTLYRHDACRVELEVEVPREVVRARDASALDARLSEVMTRFPSLDAATASEAWNGRLAEPFPPDYDVTLAEWRYWKAEMHNETVAARLGEAEAGLARLAADVRSDPAWADGFSAGVVERRKAGEPRCDAIVAGRSVVRAARKDDLPREARAADAWRAGFRDGQRLVDWLYMLEIGPACYVPLPEPPPADEARLAPERG